MKTTELKKLIKEAVKEAIQEELKDILLEAVRSPKMVMNESVRDTYAQPNISQPRQLTAEERRNMFSGILGEMQHGGAAKTAYAGNMQVAGPIDPVNGTLPEGQVGLDQIMSLMGGR
jgi:hypothetical protein